MDCIESSTELMKHAEHYGSGSHRVTSLTRQVCDHSRSHIHSSSGIPRCIYLTGEPIAKLDGAVNDWVWGLIFELSAIRFGSVFPSPNRVPTSLWVPSLGW
jgi:hypothetical protein